MSEQVQTRIDQLPDCRPSSPAEALEWLGNTVEEVAEGLRARGIKGHRVMAGRCPLALYLREWWPAAWVRCHSVWSFFI